MSDDFYATLPAVEDFSSLATPDVYRPLPAGWSVVAADVARSTKAIEAGAYKAVNTVGVAVIAAVRNAARPVEVPYLFGGDGAVLCVPDRFAGAVHSALSATVAMADSAFGLELRAAVVPISWVREHDRDVLLARHRVSEHYLQCGLFGGGAEFVERTLKEGGLPPEYVVTGDPGADADYDGLECRWQEIPSPAAETVAVIIEASPSARDVFTLYRWVMDRVSEIYGDASACRPVAEAGLRVALGGPGLEYETLLRRWKDTPGRRLVAKLLLRAYVAIGWVLLRFGVRTESTDWSTYRRDLVANTDFRKFDGTARFVLAGSEAQRVELVAFLDRLVEAGVVRYGVHVAHSALMTCLIDQRQGEHFHFVDAAGGGYASAALALKGCAPPST